MTHGTQQVQPPEMQAAQLIAKAGTRRDAEALAWAQVPREPNDAPHSRPWMYWQAVVASLVDATELPASDDVKGVQTRAYRTRLGVA